MSTRNNTRAVYVIAIVVIVVAFLLLGGGHWTKGMMHGNRTTAMANWNWVQIIISLGIGFVLGLVAAKRKW